ncbi:hypothetical protein [Roseburia sp. 499]|uniref:hypothetical protein n=1 Tax=Roseburia sp. 499 TaxID=1261634 RepID=UPI0009524B91|nr:hypothetical protein [Roseburia sp. 499]WVK69500.1 hypothetical protein BIV20_14230 [Roseburia sp. 499]
MANRSKLVNKDIAIEVIEPERVYVLLEVAPVYDYGPDGKPTETVIGHKHTVVNIDSFEKYVIKVAGTKPLISAELLAEKRENGEKVYVEFENATIKMYWNSRLNAYADSFKADGIHFVETEE